MALLRLILLPKKPSVSFATWRFRLGVCRRCDIYDPKHRTCGDNTGVLESRGVLYPNGCSCLVGIKASDRSADCYVVQMGGRSKWLTLGISVDGQTEASDADLRGGVK